VALPTPEAPIQGRYAVDGGWEFANPGPFEPQQPFTMLVVEQRGDWVKVELPVRPNGTTGWVAAEDVTLSATPYRIEVRLSERTLRAFKAGEQIAETQVVIGTPFTQTPTGRFYVTDIVPQTSAFYGPVALALNGYSELLDEFDNGVPVVALHGTNRPEQVGQAISNGCIRVPNEVIQQLAETVPRGTPVDVFP
jgi:lipoprotein-anchoring transpeptidase ErfK/SrfK